jgi:hypothetical protein
MPRTDLVPTLLTVDLYEDFIDEEGVAVTSVTEVEPVVQPDCVTNDVGRKPVTLICIHAEIVSQTKLIWQYPKFRYCLNTDIEFIVLM